jgi:hypothetical protein
MVGLILTARRRSVKGSRAGRARYLRPPCKFSVQDRLT